MQFPTGIGYCAKKIISWISDEPLSNETIQNIGSRCDQFARCAIGSVLGGALVVSPSTKFAVLTAVPLTMAVVSHSLVTRAIEDNLKLNEVSEHERPNMRPTIRFLNIPTTWIKVAAIFGMCAAHFGSRMICPVVGLGYGVFVSSTIASYGALAEFYVCRSSFFNAL